MAIEKIQIQQFISLSANYPVLDVRSPGEYLHAHIPGAYSMPLFTDQERAVVGTLYKQEGRETAIRMGLDYFGVKMRRMVEEIAQQYPTLIPKGSKHYKTDTAKPILVYCWRGGMRSAGVAWLLDLYGFKVFTLAGGYKTFRGWVLDQFTNPGPIQILGGYTGSGKTDLLQYIKIKGGSKIIDLEGLANHKGSAFGAIGMLPQPSQEMFENKLARAFFDIRLSADHNELGYPKSFSPEKPIWLEDESQRIGSVNIPGALWERMRKSVVYFLDIPFEERLKYLNKTYGKLNRGDLAAAITRIQKRLGGLETKTSLGYLVEENISGCFEILLKYYDKKYKKSLANREEADLLINMVKCDRVDSEKNAIILTDHVKILCSDGTNN